MPVLESPVADCEILAGSNTAVEASSVVGEVVVDRAGRRAALAVTVDQVVAGVGVDSLF